MKKLIVVKLLVILVLIALCDFMYIKYSDTKNNNEKLKFEIQKTKMEIKTANTEIDLSKTNIDKLKEEKKDSIWELDSWKLMKEKIEKAL